MRKILSTLFTILICLGVSVLIGAFLDFYFNSYPIFVFIFLILGAIAVYLINRGRSYGSANKSSSNTCSLCEGQGKVRSHGGFFSIEQNCPTCNGKGYSNNTPTNKDKNKYKPMNSGRGFFDTIGYLVLGAIVFSLYINFRDRPQLNTPTSAVNPYNYYKKSNEDGVSTNFVKNLDVKKLLLSKEDSIPGKTIIKDGKKELYDFCEKEGFNTTDKGIKECGLLINKRLLEASINPKEIDTSQGTEEILNKLEEQGKIIKKMEQREKVRRAINVYKAYKNSGLF